MRGQTHFAKGDALLLRIMQELLHAHVPLGGGCHLFEQITTDELSLKSFVNCTSSIQNALPMFAVEGINGFQP